MTTTPIIEYRVEIRPDGKHVNRVVIEGTPIAYQLPGIIETAIQDGYLELPAREADAIGRYTGLPCVFSLIFERERGPERYELDGVVPPNYPRHPILHDQSVEVSITDIKEVRHYQNDRLVIAFRRVPWTGQVEVEKAQHPD